MHPRWQWKETGMLEVEPLAGPVTLYAGTSESRADGELC